MGTRADFYVGRNKDAEWIGSIAFDGYRDGIPDEILNAGNEEDYRASVAAMIANRDDGTTPEMGWPWPWDSSELTDCSYWFFDGRVWDEPIDFPDMKDKMNMAVPGSSRSGLMVVSRRA